MNQIFQRIRPEPVQQPWEEWEFDKAFLQSLSRYNEEHPDSDKRLDNVLDAINTGLEASEDLFELIPDSPFPARGLVIALGCLIKLGINVSRAKKNTYEFAKQVTNWVEDVKTAFEGNENGRHFTWTTWRSLRKARELINEICLWACARLEDGRWKQIGNGLRIGKEIDDFKKRLAESKELFRDLSLIHIAGGVQRLTGSVKNLTSDVENLTNGMKNLADGTKMLTDAMASLNGGMKTVRLTIKSVLLRQDKILSEIRKIKRQQRDQLEYLINEIDAQKQADVRQAFFEKNLNRHVVDNPTYDEQGKHPCDEGTRVEELALIKEWLHSISSGSQNLLWLTGDPGCGKSAITASLAEHCLDEDIPLAQFFINRNKKETTNPNSYFPSIARQLADMSTEIERAVYQKLKQKPTLASRMSSNQAASLFVDTLAVAAKLDSSRIVAVIIDGLDETDKSHLRDTATIFSHLFKSLTRHPNVKVFISSRTEDDIRNPFAQNLKDKHVKHVHLDTANSMDDVASYLRKELVKVVADHDLNWEVWPREDRTLALGARASGLFIWAVTVIRYLRERIEEDGKECLNDVLDELTGEALEGINTLYMLILRSTQKKHATDWDFEKFRRIIGTITVLREPLCLDDLTGLLNLCHGQDNTPADIVHFVKRLRTVLVAGTDAIDGKTVPRLHKSFFEFITDAELFQKLSLDCRFCVDSSLAEAEVALSCLKLITVTSKFDEEPVPPSGSLKYASRFCYSHAGTTTGGAPGLVLQDHANKVEHLPSLFSTVRRNEIYTPWYCRDLGNFGLPRMLPLSAAYPNSTEETLKKLLGTAPSKVHSLAYSPNNNQLVSGLVDGLLTLWDVRTGTEIGRFEGHSEKVHSVEFSPSGDLIASGSSDATVRIWDLSNRQLILDIRGHSDKVYFVKFSPDGKILASASLDKTVRLWNVDSGKSIILPFKHDEKVYSVVFTPDGNQVISSTHDGLVHVWDRETGKRRQKLTSFISRADEVAISPLGDRLAAAGTGGVCFWNQTSDGFVLDDSLSFKLGHGKYLFHLSFSPDGKSVVIHHNDVDGRRTHLVYDLHSRIKIPLPYAPACSVFSLSHDHSFIASSAGTGIYTWPLPHLSLLSALAPNGDVVCAFSDRTVWLENPKNLPVVGKQLEGKVGNIKQFTFTSDNAVLAAVDESSLYLWDVSTLKLLASGSLQNVMMTTSLLFLRDRRTLITTHDDGSEHTWSMTDGILRRESTTTSQTNMTLDAPLFLDVNENNVRQIAGAQWFPTTNDTSGLWAYIDGSLIRVGQDGSVVMLPSKATS